MSKKYVKIEKSQNILKTLSYVENGNIKNKHLVTASSFSFKLQLKVNRFWSSKSISQNVVKNS